MCRKIENLDGKCSTIFLPKKWGGRLNGIYTAYHVHSDLSLLDSTTKFQAYIDEAVRQSMTALGCSEHGNIFQWTAKKRACEKAGVKYLHGCEVYLTEALLMPPDPMEVHNKVMEELATVEEDVVPETYIEQRTAELMASGQHKVRDNYHTVLIAKNEDGVRELNDLVSRAYEADHFYYKPRISFEEFLATSSNIIKTSACLASPLNKLSISHPMYERLVRHYDYLEIQPHLHPDQISFNRHLAQLSAKYGIPLIAGTDTHSLDQYKAECRTLLQDSKHIEFGGEDEFDLTFRTYDKLVEDFRAQDAIPEKLWMEAIENTNRMADRIEDFKVDASFKYPILYGDQDKEKLDEAIELGLQEKIKSGAVTPEQIQPFREAIKEECEVFDAIGMSSFMLFMSEMIRWCKQNGIPVGFSRGSVGGSRVAYLTDIIDLNPETWHTVFSRFANKDRKEIGDWTSVSRDSNVVQTTQRTGKCRVSDGRKEPQEMAASCLANRGSLREYSYGNPVVLSERRFSSIPERWHIIDGYSDYAVTELGRVFSLRQGHLRELKLKGRFNPDRYLQIAASKDDGGLTYLQVHRLVAKYFCDGYFDGAVVNHKDSNKHNNVYWNLEWITQKENIHKSYISSGIDQMRNYKTYLLIDPDGGVLGEFRGGASLTSFINEKNLKTSASSLRKYRESKGFKLIDIA